MQASFASGEIAPILHARTDLAKYHTALAELRNMIVLPQGGATRRAGFERWGASLWASGVKFIPFEYSTTDSVMLELSSSSFKVWQKTSEGLECLATVNGLPYSSGETKDVRYVQSGNVMFLTHKNYKPMMIRRNSLTSWSVEELPYHGGPFVEGDEWARGVKLKISGQGSSKTITSVGGEVFRAGMEGTLLKVEYPVEAMTEEIESELSPSEKTSSVFEVKGTLNIMTAGEWVGVIKVERSADGGETWVTVRQYVRTDPDTQGQWDFTLSETEEGVLYRVKAQHKEK